MIHNPQSGGIHLPTLTNPAGAAQILSGYQAINADGEIITGNIPSQGAQTITPGTSNKTISSGQYLSGAQTIKGDANLVPANIAEGVSIFGVTGTHSGGGGWKEISYSDFISISQNNDTAIPQAMLRVLYTGEYGADIFVFEVTDVLFRGSYGVFACSLQLWEPMSILCEEYSFALAGENSGNNFITITENDEIIDNSDYFVKYYGAV